MVLNTTLEFTEYCLLGSPPGDLFQSDLSLRAVSAVFTRLPPRTSMKGSAPANQCRY